MFACLSLINTSEEHTSNLLWETNIKPLCTFGKRITALLQVSPLFF